MDGDGLGCGHGAAPEDPGELRREAVHAEAQDGLVLEYAGQAVDLDLVGRENTGRIQAALPPEFSSQPGLERPLDVLPHQVDDLRQSEENYGDCQQAPCQELQLAMGHRIPCSLSQPTVCSRPLSSGISGT